MPGCVPGGLWVTCSTAVMVLWAVVKRATANAAWLGADMRTGWCCCHTSAPAAPHLSQSQKAME